MADIFGPDQIKHYADMALSDVPDGRSHALIGYILTNGNWRVTYAHRVGDHWQLSASAEADRLGGKIQGGVEVRASW